MLRTNNGFFIHREPLFTIPPLPYCRVCHGRDGKAIAPFKSYKEPGLPPANSPNRVTCLMQRFKKKKRKNERKRGKVELHRTRITPESM